MLVPAQDDPELKNVIAKALGAQNRFRRMKIVPTTMKNVPAMSR
jgi:hypothetical protein